MVKFNLSQMFFGVFILSILFAGCSGDVNDDVSSGSSNVLDSQEDRGNNGNVNENSQTETVIEDTIENELITVEDNDIDGVSSVI